MGIRTTLIEIPVKFSIWYMILFVFSLVGYVMPKRVFNLRRWRPSWLFPPVWSGIRTVQHYLLIAILVFWGIFYGIYLFIKMFIPWPIKNPLLRIPPLKQFRSAGLFAMFDRILEVIPKGKSVWWKLREIGVAIAVFVQRNAQDLLRTLGIAKEKPSDVDLEDEEKERAKEREKRYKRFMKRRGIDDHADFFERYFSCVEENIRPDFDPEKNAAALIQCRQRSVTGILDALVM